MAETIEQRIVEMEKEQLKEVRERARRARQMVRDLENSARRGFPTGCREGLANHLRASLGMNIRLSAWHRRLVAEAKAAAARTMARATATVRD